MVDPETPSGSPVWSRPWEDEEFLAAAHSMAELHPSPLLAVLDTGFVFTGLHNQVRSGQVPISLRTIQDGTIRVFMEKETLLELVERLPRFAEKFGVPTQALVDLLREHWLPHIRVVSIPDSLREDDPRALAVLERDADDYPAAVLASLLSPCVLLAHNRKDFAPLGIHDSRQAVMAVKAAVTIQVGERQMNAVAMVPVLPAAAIEGGVKWSYDRFGPVAIVVTAIVVTGLIVLYTRQSDERKRAIKSGAVTVGKVLLEEMERATNEVSRGRRALDSCMVPGPAVRRANAELFRELAISDEGMTAAELAEVIFASDRPSVTNLRVLLRENNGELFREVSRGRYTLGHERTLKYR